MTIIDISTLPAPEAIESLSYEDILDFDIAKFKAAWAEVRADNPDSGLPDYDVEMLETDPGVIILEGIAYSDLRLRDRVNVALKAVLPAFSTGTNLDGIVARVGVARASGETDKQLLERYFVKLSAPSAGSRAGYLSRVLDAWPLRGAADVLGPDTHGRRGEIDVILAAPAGGVVAEEIKTLVRAAVTASDAKPFTDFTSVRSAGIVAYEIRQRLTIAEGRTTAPIVAAALAAAEDFVADRFVIGQSIARSAILATSYVGGVIKVEDLTDAGDIDVAADEVAWCEIASIVIEVAT
jgi:phage-related baseplate assembly protein